MRGISQYNVAVRLTGANSTVWRLTEPAFIVVQEQDAGQGERIAALHVPRVCQVCGQARTLAGADLKVRPGKTYALPLGCGGKRANGSPCKNFDGRAIDVTMPKRWR